MSSLNKSFIQVVQHAPQQMFSILFENVFGARSVDCPFVINLGKSLHLDSVNSAMWSKLENANSCCSSGSGVTCSSQLVSRINWSGLGLFGHIKDPLIINYLTGTIPHLPANLIDFGVSQNSLHGNVPPLPATIENLFIDTTQLSGVLSLNSPIQLYTGNTYITDISIIDPSRIDPFECDVSDTPMLGKSIVAVLQLHGCIVSGLYLQSSLPFTLSSIFKSLGISKSRSKLETSTVEIPKEDSLTRGMLILPTLFPSIVLELNSAEQNTSEFDETLKIVAQATKTTIVNEQGSTDMVDSLVIYFLLGGIVGIFAILVIASNLFKRPSGHSKFSRKNSFGTLNTVQTKQ